MTPPGQLYVLTIIKDRLTRKQVSSFVEHSMVIDLEEVLERNYDTYFPLNTST